MLEKMVFIIKQNDSSYAAADLGFHRWGDNPKGGANLLFGQNLPQIV